MKDFLKKRIILGICGSISVYKSIYLLRKLIKLGAEVHVVMTESAKKLISPIIFQVLSNNLVHTRLFSKNNYYPKYSMKHISLAQWADYLIIYPASANCLSKMAHGLADNLLSTLYLVSSIPVIVCPSMNHSMWMHNTTQNNYKYLKNQGVLFVGPDKGFQACGNNGFGRLSKADDVINTLRLYKVSNLLRGKEILITAGPTYEYIDPVRYIGNNSSGKMGYALAEAANLAGAKVILISGPTKLYIPTNIEVIFAYSAQSMCDIVMKHLNPGSIFISAAAVSDYSIKKYLSKKIKKNTNKNLKINLIRNPDIISKVSNSNKASFVVGFAAETEYNMIDYAKNKLENKNLDMIIVNKVGNGIGFQKNYNKVIVLTKNIQINLPFNHKVRIAGQIIKILASILKNQ